LALTEGAWTRVGYSAFAHVEAGGRAGAPDRVFTGSGGRRNWSAEEKAAIVAESYGSEDTVLRRCPPAAGLTHSQLFGWRREARRRLVAGGDAPPLFVPVVVEACVAEARNARPQAYKRT